jgi:uncharacterized protein (TIGR02646 family)
MRRFKRSGYVVPTLADTGVAGKKRLSHRKDFEGKGRVPRAFPAHWTKSDVRGLLHAMQGRICAYCLAERPLDVEHFRPKAGYWWLAYDVTNYVLACTACNRDRKGTQFPLRTGATRITYDNRGTIAAEARVLLDPVDDDVESYFALEDDPTCPILPAPELDAAGRHRVREVIDFFGLNLDATVRSKRSVIFEQALRAIQDGRWSDVQKMAMRHSEQSFAARFALAKLAPQYLPSEQDELLALVSMLWGDLKVQLAKLRKLKARETRRFCGKSHGTTFEPGNGRFEKRNHEGVSRGTAKNLD